MQTRRGSLLEKTLDLASGFLLSWAIQVWWLFPALGIQATKQENTIIIVVLTAVSFARGYLWRRLFNGLEKK